MSISIGKVAVLAVVAALLVTLAALRPTAQTPAALASLEAPGGIAALPSALPAVPGIMNQQIPAVIGTGQLAIVTVFCAPPLAAGSCPDLSETGSLYGTITLKLTQVYPTKGAVPMATFAATGSDTLSVTDNSAAEMDAAVGVVAVQVDAAAATEGGTKGVNEIVKVTATDETGDARSVDIAVVDTILAWGPTGQVSTASQEQPVYVSYHCDVLGRGSRGILNSIPIRDIWCGGNTSRSLYDDFVDFQTDKGIFSIHPLLGPGCSAGKTVSASDGSCDLDGSANGVVTTMLLGNGDVGVATITAQQGGGVAPARTVNVTFVGDAAAGGSLSIDGPQTVGLTGAKFTVTAADQNDVPVGNETVQCTVDPASAALALLPQTGTTDATTGQLTVTLVPTGASVAAGQELTIACVLDRAPSISATTKVTLGTAPSQETKDLMKGCNPIAATWPDGTPSATVSGAVAPADALTAIWKSDPATGTWKAHSPDAPAAVNDLASINRLDAVFICVNAAAKVSRPVI